MNTPRLIVFSIFMMAAVITAFTQTPGGNEKEIRQLAFDNEPVEIVSLQNAERVLELDEKFQQETDWLKSFVVTIKNKSGKAINYLKIELDFPETKSTGNVMAFPISYGVNPVSGKINESSEVVKPGETVQLVLTDKMYANLKAFIGNRHPLESLSRLDIRIVFVHFDDDSAWISGNFMRRDPNDPKKFVLAESN